LAAESIGPDSAGDAHADPECRQVEAGVCRASAGLVQRWVNGNQHARARQLRQGRYEQIGYQDSRAGHQRIGRTHPCSVGQAGDPVKSRERVGESDTKVTIKAYAAPMSSDAKSKPGRNPLGIHSFVWVGGWDRAQCEYAVASTATAGYDLVEVSGMQPAAIDIDHTRQTLADAGLAATVTLGLPVSGDINSEDPERIEQGRRILMGALDLTSGIGSDFLGGVIFGALNKYNRPTTEAARANSAAVIREVAQEARSRGVRIGLEFVNRYESNLLNTVQQTLDYIDQVGEPNVFVHADVYHMNIEERNFRDPLLACGDRLGYIHIGESNRGYLGTGTIDFDEIFSALIDMDYRGAVTFESFSSRIVDDQLAVALCVWRDLWEDSMDLAVHAKAFIEQRLGA
jgi:D-psicose/D-tagatose/L-ribulose 3-epimerase